MNQPLAGKRIWLTRPAHQAAPWARELEAGGAEVVCEPLLEIEPPVDIEAAGRGLHAAQTADLVIATSTNAVRSAWQLRPDFAPVGTLYGVGAASADALAAACGRPVAQPRDAFSSERLLALTALADLKGRSVALLSGEGGRGLIAETLVERGAGVIKVALYRRRGVAIGRARLAALIDASDAVVVTSGEALSHLLALVDDELCEALARLLLVAPSARVVKQANQRLRWTHAPVVAARMSGVAVAAALAWVWQGERQ